MKQAMFLTQKNRPHFFEQIRDQQIKIGFQIDFKPVIITISVPPEIKYTKNAYPMSHESATIECLAHGNPTPTINWYYDYPSPSSNKGPLNTTDNVKIVSK